MNEAETLALCAALEAAAGGGESCVLINERAELVQSESARRMLDEAGVDRADGPAWLTAPDAADSRSLDARCVARDFPRAGWSTHLLRRAVDREDALHDHHAARAFRREQVHLGKARHDLRGIANNVLLSVEIASRRLAATPGSEAVLAALQQVKKHAARFVEEVSGLGAPDAAHAQDEAAVVDLGDVVSRAVRGCLIRGVSASVDVVVPVAPVLVCSRPQQLRSGLIDALDSLRSAPGASPVHVDVRVEGGFAVIDLCCEAAPEASDAESNLDTLVLANLVERDGGAVVVAGRTEGRASIQIRLPMPDSAGLGGAASSNRA